MDDGNDAHVMQFCSITGAEWDVGKSWLESHAFDLNTAVASYMEGVAGGVPAPSVESPRRRRRDSEDVVRSPILPTKHMLYDEEPGRVRAGLQVSAGPAVVEAFRDFRQEAAVTAIAKADPSGKKRQSLAALFSPPSYAVKGTFEKAKAMAVAEKKWLLINIQHAQEFDSQLLNRDLWSDERVEEMVTAHFIFWQVECTVEDGANFLSFYHVDNPPVIAVVDPRTGKLRKTWHGFLPGNDFLMQMVEALDELGSLEEPRDAGPPAKRRKGNDGAVIVVDDDLEAALALSLEGDAGAAPEREGPGTKDGHAEADARSAVPAAPAIPTEPPAPEPPPGDDNTQVKVVMPDGQRLIRRFSKTAPVEELYRFVASSLRDSGKAVPFSISLVEGPGTHVDLEARREETISAARCEKAVLTVGAR